MFRTGPGSQAAPRNHRCTLALGLIGLIGLLVGACGPQGADADADANGDAGTVPTCGDGVVDPGELCDDGNRVAGDGCSPDCVPSGMAYDCVDLLESSERQDTVTSMVSLSEGSFLVGGTVTPEFGERRGWIGRYDRSGAQKWLKELSFPDESPVSIGDLAADGLDGAWALVRNSTAPRLLHLDAQGTVISTAVLTTEGGSPVRVYAIEPTPAGIWVAGTDTEDAWLGLYDPETGAMTDLLLEDHLGYDDWITAIGRHGDEIAVAARLNTASNFIGGDVMLTYVPSDAVVIRFDLLGNELERILVAPNPDPEYSRVAYQITADASGRWFVRGSEVLLTSFFLPLSWIAPVSEPGWNWTSSEEHPDGEVTLGRIIGVDEGVLAAGGRTIGDDPSSAAIEGWVARFGPNGAVRWEFSKADDDYAQYRHRLLTLDSEGQIRTVGRANSPGKFLMFRSCLIAY